MNTSIDGYISKDEMWAAIPWSEGKVNPRTYNQPQKKSKK